MGILYDTTLRKRSFFLPDSLRLSVPWGRNLSKGPFFQKEEEQEEEDQFLIKQQR